MSQIWGMINGMQLLVNLPLFQVAFPEMSLMMVEQLIAIATFDVMPTDDIFGMTIDPPESDQEDSKFIDVGYESNLFVVNLGTLFLMLIFLFTMPICICITKPCKNRSKWLANKH